MSTRAEIIIEKEFVFKNCITKSLLQLLQLLQLQLQITLLQYSDFIIRRLISPESVIFLYPIY